ncbi:MAG TPA: LamG-like jellyroll fold domain-containing protein [Chitinivibrionales bacterium]|jgi:hypothetical protein|nr:LamG-like jellyroll fold domain-containing protein [Chitinivibrionales bacterium]
MFWISLIVSACIVQAQVPTGLVAQYHCDEGRDSILHDSGPYANNIALHNVLWAAGKSGSCLVFNGTNSYGVVTAQSGTSLDFGTGDFTVALWINTTSPSNAGHKENILSKGDPFNSGVTLSIEHGITYACVGSTALEGFSWSIKPVNDGKWHYYVCVRKTGIVSVYNDTVLVSSYSFSGSVTVSTAMFLGRHGATAQEYYNGMLDEISLYSRALTFSEISAGFRSVNISTSVPVLISIPSPTENRQPTFAWHHVPSENSYTITIDTNRQFQSLLIHIPVSDTVFVPLTPLPLGTMYWNVSCNDTPAGRYSSVDSVVIVAHDPYPTVLIPVTPDPTIERRPRLTWHNVSAAKQYALIIADNIAFSGPIVSIQLSDTSFLPLSDLPIGTIYWEVKSDTSLRFATSSFTIQPDSIPLLYRFNGATVSQTRPVFRWHPVSSATSYTLQVDTVVGFANPVYIMPTPDTTFVPLIDLTAGGTYYWRVSCSRNASLFSPEDTVRISQTPVFIADKKIGGAGAAAAIRLVERGSHQSLSVRIPETEGRIMVTLLSVSGKTLLRSESQNAQTLDIPLQSRMTSGVYIVRVTAGVKTYSSRVFLDK